MSKPKPTYINTRGETVDLDLNDGEIVPPGYGIRVSSFLMDADPVQQAIAANSQATRVVDAFGAPAGNRPGYCFPAANRQTQLRDQAYEDMVNRQQSAWKTPQVTAPVVMDNRTQHRDAAAVN